MRPDRAIVKKAISDAGGNLSKAAALLGCSRPTLYTWIYQLGLERHAGIRLDTQTRLYGRDRKDTRDTVVGKTIKSGVKTGVVTGPMLRVVTSQAPVEMPIAATVKLTDALWRRAKIEAIRRGIAVSEYVKGLLEADLAASEHMTPRSARNGKGNEGGER